MGFRVTAAGLNARIPQAVPGCSRATSESGSVDAHAIQPFYTGLLARACGLTVDARARGRSDRGDRPVTGARQSSAAAP